MRNRILHVLLAGLMSLALTGCGVIPSVDIDPAESTPAPTSAVTTVESAPVPAFGGTLRIAIRNPKTLNPLLNTDRSVDQLLKLIYEPLYSLDERYKPVGVLAKAISFSEDGRTVSIEMHSDHLYHDGTSVTAYDVAYSVEMIRNAPEDSVYKSSIKHIDGIRVDSDYSFTLELKQATGLIAYDLNFPIIKDGSDEDESATFIPVGSGNYAYSGYTSMKALTLTAATAAKNKVYVEAIEGKITRDESVEADAFNHSVVNLINPAKFDWSSYAQRSKDRMFEYTSNYLEFLGFNFKSPLLEDKAVRKAIAYGLDRETLAKDRYLSHVTITDGILHPDSWLYTVQEETYSYDIEASQAMLSKEMLVDTDGDGFYDTKANEPGVPILLNLLVSEDNENRVAVAQLIREQLADIGLKVNVDIQSSENFKAKLAVGEYDMVLSGWKLSDEPDFFDMFHSSMQVTGSNFIRYNNAFMDQALTAVRTSYGEEALLANVQKLDQLYRDELPYFSLFFIHSVVQTDETVKGELRPTTDHTLRGIESVYLNTK